ncbi:hypothetical protein PS903_03618 [Pseudomonas fluorescens]|nr:hypothetical protein PS903_03618 [Pseudomonas fluorescens]
MGAAQEKADAVKCKTASFLYGEAVFCGVRADAFAVGERLAREADDAVSPQVRIPRPLTSNRAQPIYNTAVATSMKVIATLIRISETPRMP